MSSGAETKVRYQDVLRQEALSVMGNRPKLAGNLYVRIVWCHGYRTTQDVDNIAKRILDALKGVVYEDDNPVVKCLIEKIYSGAGVTLTTQEYPPKAVLDKLQALIFRNAPDVLYIEVGQVESQQFVFGAIDRGAL